MEFKNIKNHQKEIFIKNLEKAYTEGVYADTPANRKLGRVGMSYKEWTSKQQGQSGEDKNKTKFKSIEDLPWEEGRTGDYFELNNHRFDRNFNGYFVDEESVDEKKVLNLANKYSNSEKEYPVKNKKEEGIRTRRVSKELLNDIERDKKSKEKTKEITKDLKSLDDFIPKTNGGRKYLRRGDRELKIFILDKNNPKSITYSNNKGEILYNKNAALDFINNKENLTNNNAMGIYHDTIDNFIENNKGKQLDGKSLFDILERKGIEQWKIDSIEERGKNLGWDNNKVKKDIIYNLVKIEEKNFKDSVENKEDLQNKIENYLSSLKTNKEKKQNEVEVLVNKTETLKNAKGKKLDAIIKYSNSAKEEGVEGIKVAKDATDKEKRIAIAKFYKEAAEGDAENLDEIVEEALADYTPEKDE